LFAVALATPLQVPEVLAVAWSVHFTWPNFWSWAAQATDPSPLGCLIQSPFIFLFGVSRLGTRVPSLLFAVGSALLFLRLAQRTLPRHHTLALSLFMLLPLQWLIFTSSIQFEAATFFVILATLAFFALVQQPNVKGAMLLVLTTAACLFSDHHAGLPVFGAVLFLLRFSPRPQERRALWFALASCVCAVSLYAPYYIWGSAQKNSHWLTEPALSLASIPELPMLDWVLLPITLIIFAGVFVAAAATFRPALSRFAWRLTWFSLFGSVVLTVGFILASSIYTLSPIAPRDLMFAAPPTIILFVAGLHWFARESKTRMRLSAIVLSGAVLVAFALADFEILAAPKQDLALESRYVAPELTKNACVVFVSEYFSRPLFFIFQPQLEARECKNFFHHRIVLASHPYVRPDQQAGAEGAFLGLSFQEVKRIRSGGGQIVVFDAE
jgi:4-amino-4-deoxy-L-arabinose transferase-like glycosyltransferase